MQQMAQGGNNGFNRASAGEYGAEDLWTTQFDFSEYESRTNQGYQPQHYRHMVDALSNDVGLGQLTAMAFDPGDLSWLNAVPLDF